MLCFVVVVELLLLTLPPTCSSSYRSTRFAVFLHPSFSNSFIACYLTSLLDISPWLVTLLLPGISVLGRVQFRFQIGQSLEGIKAELQKIGDAVVAVFKVRNRVQQQQPSGDSSVVTLMGVGLFSSVS
ncbi:hypothetical protein R1flu_011867 [Riccia fluitans]|uniref:Uncharacterized protein n=1 Tax=Riccia fluitans TaxID=41844 RepID=A0ABD1Z8Z4_9MARC